MKTAIITRADDSVKEMIDITHPMIKNYAQKINADYININHNNYKKTSYAYRILDLYSLLDDFDRVLNLDSDILISNNCPNIFDEVPENKIGSVFEDKGSRQNDRRSRIKKIQNKFGDVTWTDGYINTGVFVVSKIHKAIFQKINNDLWLDAGLDDVHLGWQIHKNNFEIYELNFKWNHMTMFSEKWNNCANRFNSNIIHYAGHGLFDKYNKIDQIKNDLNILNKGK